MPADNTPTIPLAAKEIEALRKARWGHPKPKGKHHTQGEAIKRRRKREHQNRRANARR